MAAVARSNSSSIVSRIKDTLIYHRLYAEPPPRSELAMSQLTDDGLPLAPPPLPPSMRPYQESSRNSSPRSQTPISSGTPKTTGSSKPPASKKKIRFVCISDTHGASPLDGVFKVPPGDVLIHAGDMTNQGAHSELQKTVDWLQEMPHEVKLVIAGNHDGVTLDPAFHADFGSYFPTPTPQSHEQNLSLFTSDTAKSHGIRYLVHEAQTITLRDGRSFKVFGSPWSPKCGLWGFGYESASTLEESLWKDIPEDTDILITHGPPKFHLDAPPATIPPAHAGCEHLRQSLWRVRPLLHVFGHVHKGRGVERVVWDTDSKFVQYKEGSVKTIEDPEPDGKKHLVIDLVRKDQLQPRKETCLVNAAIRTGPYRKGLGLAKWRRKSIVVDLEVPLDTARGYTKPPTIRGALDGSVDGAAE